MELVLYVEYSVKKVDIQASQKHYISGNETCSQGRCVDIGCYVCVFIESVRCMKEKQKRWSRNQVSVTEYEVLDTVSNNRVCVWIALTCLRVN
jgi:hypothetical protein